MAHFLGMTRCGTPNLFACSSRRVEHERRAATAAPPQEQRKAIARVPIDKFIEVFQRWASDTAEHTGSSTVRQLYVPEVFEEVLERQLEHRELELLLKHFDIEGHISLNEFLRKLQRFREEEHPAVQRGERLKTTGEDRVAFGRYSYGQLKDLRGKHTRNDFGPIDALNYPLTTNQKYGWHSDARIIQKKHFPRRSTEVTRNEGVCLTNYYLLH